METVVRSRSVQRRERRFSDNIVCRCFRCSDGAGRMLEEEDEVVDRDGEGMARWTCRGVPPGFRIHNLSSSLIVCRFRE